MTDLIHQNFWNKFFSSELKQWLDWNLEPFSF